MQRSYLIYIFFIFGSCFQLFAQFEASNWYYGTTSGLNFNNSPPTFISGLPTFISSGGTSCISDQNGNVVLYWAGNKLRNTSHLAVANSSFIIDGSYMHSDLIVKKPGVNSIYYMISVTYPDIHYSVIDMSLAAGMGSVTALNVVLGSGNLVDMIAATRHCNNTDIWITVAMTTPNEYRSFLLTSSGFSSTPVISPIASAQMGSTQLKFSPSGRKIAVRTQNTGVLYCDFDRSTGIVSNPLLIGNLISGGGGIEFSPDETKLYVGRQHNIYQYDLCAGSPTAITASELQLWNGGPLKNSIQLGIDGKIYVHRDGDMYFGIINNPNVTGVGCNYVDLGPFGGTLSYALPTFVSNYFYQTPLSQFTANVNSSASCFSVSFLAPPTPTSVCSINNFTFSTRTWYFGDPASGAANVSTSTNPVHVYPGPGTYTVKLVYNYNCGADTLRQVLTLNGPTISVVASTVTCAGPANASVNVNGGLGPFTFSWTPSNQSNSVAAGLAPGNHTVRVYDVGAGCSTIANFSVASNYSFTGSMNTTSVLCFGNSTGAATVNILGGTGNYSLTWSGNTSTNTTASNLLAGPYTVSVIDLGGPCTMTQTLNIAQPNAALNLLLVANTLSTCVSNSVSLFANVNGGTSPYSYAWMPVSAGSVNVVSGASAGSYNYSLAVTDQNSCTANSSISIFYSNAPLVNLTSATICAGETATLYVNGASSYTWYPGGQMGSTFTCNPNQTSFYTVSAYSLGCVVANLVTTSVVVVPPPSLNISLSSASLCSQAFNGSPNTITLTASGANSYTLYTPNLIGASVPNGTSTPVSSMPPFSSSVTIGTATLVGSNGVCTSESNFVFTVVPNPTVGVNSFTPFICAGQQYTYTSYGANSYTWSATTPNYTTYNNGGVAVTHPSVNSVFSVYGTSLGCNSALKISTITVYALPAFSLEPNGAEVCLNEKITLKANGSGSSYLWEPATGLQYNIGSTVIASPPSTQIYTVTATANSCTSTANFTLIVLPLPIAIMQAPLAVCPGNSITLSGSGGRKFEWRGPLGVYYEGQNISFVAHGNTFSGNYSLTVTDAKGCKNTTSKFIDVLPLPNANLLGIKDEACVPYCKTYSVDASANTSAVWQISGNVQSGKTFVQCYTEPGTYKITGYIRDEQTGCENELYYFVKLNPKPHADFVFSPKEPIENLDEVIFTNNSTGNDLTGWNWFFTDNKGYRTGSQNTSYLYTEPGSYNVAMVVSNKYKCADTVVKTIEVKPDFAIYVPNAFTPNGDERNDVFLPIVRSVKKYNLQIFDRWGKLLFQTQDPNQGWDGTYNGVVCKQDAYIWKINLVSIDGKEKIETGNVTCLPSE